MLPRCRSLGDGTAFIFASQEEEFEQIEEIFSKMDTNADGYVSRASRVTGIRS